MKTEHVLISKILVDRDITQALDANIKTSFFGSEASMDAWDWILKYRSEYNEVPPIEAFLRKFPGYELDLTGKTARLLLVVGNGIAVVIATIRAVGPQGAREATSAVIVAVEPTALGVLKSVAVEVGVSRPPSRVVVVAIVAKLTQALAAPLVHVPIAVHVGVAEPAQRMLVVAIVSAAPLRDVAVAVEVGVVAPPQRVGIVAVVTALLTG